MSEREHRAKTVRVAEGPMPGRLEIFVGGRPISSAFDTETIWWCLDTSQQVPIERPDDE